MNINNIKIVIKNEEGLRAPKKGDVFEIEYVSYDEYAEFWETQEYGQNDKETRYTADSVYAFKLLEEEKQRLLALAEEADGEGEEVVLEFDNCSAELTRIKYKGHGKEKRFVYSETEAVRIRNLTALAEKADENRGSSAKES